MYSLTILMVVQRSLIMIFFYEFICPSLNLCLSLSASVPASPSISLSLLLSLSGSALTRSVLLSSPEFSFASICLSHSLLQQEPMPSSLCLGPTTIRLRTFRLRHFVYRHSVYRHFVYYCIPAYRTVVHPTYVSANHYFHQFQLLLTL